MFLKTNLFNSGQRPAIDAGLSVSRVGSAAQKKYMKQVSGSLKLELAQYFELESFSQFSSDLDAETKAVLEHGKKVLTMIKQPASSPYHQVDEAILLFGIKNKYIDKIPAEYVAEYKQYILDHFKKLEVRKALEKENEFSKNIELKITGEYETLTAKFLTKLKALSK